MPDHSPLEFLSMELKLRHLLSLLSPFECDYDPSMMLKAVLLAIHRCISAHLIDFFCLAAFFCCFFSFSNLVFFEKKKIRFDETNGVKKKASSRVVSTGYIPVLKSTCISFHINFLFN